MKVANYVLLHSDESYSKLEFEVRQMLETGWQPLGGPFLTPDRVWFQAMVLPDCSFGDYRNVSIDWAGPDGDCTAEILVRKAGGQL